MIGRNAAEGFDSFNLSTRLSRTFAMGDKFRLEAIAEGSTFLNHRNDLIPNSTFGTGVYPMAPRATFGAPIAVGDPRQVQLALRILF
jgi:hypothetical protein